MNITKWPVIVAAALLVPVSALAQTLEEQERLNAIDKAIGAIDNLRALSERMSKEKKLQCMTAIGNDKFCDCLAQNLPVTTNFVNYVAIITLTKDEIGYGKLSKDDKLTVDNSRTARDKCIGLR